MNLKKISYQFMPIHLRGGEQKSASYRALNPQAMVPALEADGLVLTQSLAIIEWLDEKYAEPRLLPNDTDKRAQVRAFSQIIACDTHPLQNLRVLEFLRNELKQDQAAVDGWCRRWVGEGLLACEKILNRQDKAGLFCFGDQPTLADICLVPQVYSAERFGVDLTEMPRVREITEYCQTLSSFSDAHPNRQPDNDL